MDTPSPILAARLYAFFAPRRAVAWRRVPGGYTSNDHWVVTLDDGSTRFVKVAAGARTAAWLRAEYRVYSQLDVSFMPGLRGWMDDNRAPFLVLEDLSAASWPPPWDQERVDAVRHTLDLLHSTSLDLPKLTPESGEALGGWRTVSKDPYAFLSTGLCSRAWLDHALPLLIKAADAAPLEGNALVHLDVRSDNLCFDGHRTVFVDWNRAARGNPTMDLALWAPSLHAEGGPAPEELLPDAPEWAALVSGQLATRAGETAMRDAERVRRFQMDQLQVALPWAVRSLSLPPLDGWPKAEQVPA